MKFTNNGENAEYQYLDLCREILENGIKKGDRTGTGTLSLFGKTIIHDYECGFPLLTTKKMFLKGIIYELLWFLKGTDDASYLVENNIHIWDEWMQEKDGKKILPHTYGVKWRNFDGTDQIAEVINSLKKNPNSRRHIVSAWDPRHIGDAALPWCHCFFQFYVSPPTKDGEKSKLSIMVVQRSADIFLGVPFNIASYSALLYMFCSVLDMSPGRMIYNFGDCHVYKKKSLSMSRVDYSKKGIN